MTKYIRYIVRLEGDPYILAVLQPFVPDRVPTLAEARELRAAITLVFQGQVSLRILSVRDRTGDEL